MTTAGGHVFVVHGRIEAVVHDFVIVPTSTAFTVRGYWKPILGSDPEQLRPRDWPGTGVARAHGRENVWFVNVGGRHAAGIGLILDRAVAALREIAATSPQPGRNRTKPVVAVPVLGIAGGGLGAERGEVIRQLLVAMADAAHDLDLDVAVVTPDASIYGAAQYVRCQTGSWPLSDRQLTKACALGAMAQQGQLALFMGAGVSIPAGLPTWGALLEQLADVGKIPLHDNFSRLSPVDQAQYLNEVVPELGHEVARIIRGTTVPSLSHTFLAALGCREAVTTNYDRLYEKAIRFQRGRQNVATVLPWEPPRSGKQWILKMHGDVESPETIVLTRQQFVSFDADTRPAGSLLQTLLMTRHVLFVGASLNDDNVVRLAYEVDRFRKKYRLQGRVGTLLDVDDDRFRSQLWKGKLTWLTMRGATIAERSRTLEIFLDAVAAYASSDSSWLLDERFRGLIGVDDALVQAARSLYARAAVGGSAWQPVADALAAFGAAAGEYDEETESRRWRSQLQQ